MDEIDSKQQTEIHDLQKTDVEHWQEMAELGRRALKFQIGLAYAYVWLLVISIILIFIKFNNFQIDIRLTPQ